MLAHAMPASSRAPRTRRSRHISARTARAASGLVTPSGIPTRPLGRTGVDVSCLALGGWHLGSIAPTLAIRLMHRAIDEGITFFDNAWDYHMGGSEVIMGRALGQGGKRQQVFLMTKNCERDAAGSMKCLEDSLRRLRTDYLDLWQFHEINYDNDPDWVFERGGLRAALQAQRQGKVRFIGFTGHKAPAIHLAMLGKPYAWASSQMPINVMDAHYRSFLREVVPVCHAAGVGVIGMKSLGGGAKQGKIPKARPDLHAPDLIHFALSQPIASLVVGIESMAELDQDLAIARKRPMNEAAQRRLLASVKAEATDGRHELFKSTAEFDGPWHRRQHGFPRAG
jgi:aryl-alcohol dehydrogenase-like predicted oxidoreductase